ncbi:MAG: acyltransferase [Candidatus Omnitrophica bacterium]|nr:acyltransferase [Candidatus Omnitrophota bacterium]
MRIQELKERIDFWRKEDRIGPDMPLTHWKLYFKSTMLRLCKEKFAYFDESAEFRPGAYAIVCSKIRIGKGVVIRPGTILHAHPGENGPGITIEDNVAIAYGVKIFLANHRYDDPDVPILFQGYSEPREAILKKGCWVGANTVITKGVVIGENSVVGAGSIVTEDIPDRVMAAGVPARVIKKIV